jgi:signal transduction histidine kinase
LPSICNWLVRGKNVANIATQPAGLGIGLYTTRRIIEAHGGKLKIESSLEKGTRAIVLLPAFVDRV